VSPSNWQATLGRRGHVVYFDGVRFCRGGTFAPITPTDAQALEAMRRYGVRERLYRGINMSRVLSMANLLQKVEAKAWRGEERAARKRLVLSLLRRYPAYLGPGAQDDCLQFLCGH
jgi:hypothetical protein